MAGAVLGHLWWTNHGRSPGSPPDTGLIREADSVAVLDHIRALNSPLILVNFWASWCEPCKVEMPHLLSLRRELAPAGLKLVLISLDDPESVANAEQFLRDQSVDFPTFYKGRQPVNMFAKIYPQWTGAVPTTVLFSRDVKIVDAWEGETALAEFQSRVKRHLSKGT